MEVIRSVRIPVRIGNPLINIFAFLVVKKVTKRRIVLFEDKELETEAKEMAKGRINNEEI